MQATDIAFIIVLFLLFDIIFYLVVVKGMMVKSIIGKEDQQRRIRNKDAPVFMVEILHAINQSKANIAGSDISLDNNANDLLKHEIEGLSLEKIDFLPPLELMVGIPTKVDVLVHQNFSEHITQCLKKIDDSKIKTLKVGAYLSAKLNAEGFEILSGPECEQLANSENRWEWEVIPTKAGQVTMGIDLGIRVAIPSGEYNRNFSWPGSAVQITANAVFIIKNLVRNYGWWLLAGITGVTGYMILRFA